MEAVSGSRLVRRMQVLEVVDGALGLYGLGQVGVALRGPQGTIYVDPYLTNYGGDEGRKMRLFEPPVLPEEVTNALGVLVTHAHLDHFDPETLGPISKASPEAVFYGPDTCDFSVAGISSDRSMVATVDNPFSVAGAKITPIPAAHTELDLSVTGYPYLGYIIEWGGVTLYHAGDTVIYDGFLERLSAWELDVMMIPINGRDYFRTSRGIIGNTDFREAAELADWLDVGLTIPTHYDLFAENAQNPTHFVDYLYHLNPKRCHHLLRPGELYHYVKETI